MPGRLKTFLTEAGATAAVEFALILPLLLLLSIGAFELQRYLRFERQFSLAAETIAAMTAQRQDANGEAPREDLDALQHIVPDAPDWYRGIAYQMSHVVFKSTVASCKANCVYEGEVAWYWPTWSDMGTLRRACGKVGVAAAGGQPSGNTLPADVFGAGGVIVVDLVTTYTPLFGSSFLKPAKLVRQGFATTRFASPYLKIDPFEALVKCNGYP